MLTLIAITCPRTDNRHREARMIARALDTRRYDRVHIRKTSVADTHALLDIIPPRYFPSISVHNATSATVDRYPGIGVHLTGSMPDAPSGFSGTLSRSCHSLDELRNLGPRLDYVFLSPVFDSISKKGYRAAFTAAELDEAATRGLIDNRVIALGGVTSARFDDLARWHFGGAAMLGAAWPEISRASFSLQFISHVNDTITDPLQGIAAALDGGCRWCQLRIKGADTDTLTAAARHAAGLCAAVGATLIVDDDVRAVRLSGAGGVHLGHNDMPVAEARRLLPDRIIGATANTADDILAALRDGADYIGLGPFRFTTTKQRLSPVLGLEGYRDIIGRVRAAGADIPIVAIGGITAADVPDIIAAGADGVAVSGAILNAPDPAAATHRLVDLLNHIQSF